MKLFTAAEMRDADARSAAAGVTTWSLMQAAGEAVAAEVARRYPGRPALVLCGKGNNGGDGYVAAGALAGRGTPVTVLELSEAPASADARRARRELLARGVEPRPLGPDRPMPPMPGGVMVDALLGSGLDRPVSGWLGMLVTGLAATGAPVVSVDVPSGVPTDAPRFVGPHVTASVTVELAGHKVAGAFYPTRAAYGERIIAPIGVPDEVLEACGGVAIVTAADVAGWLPRRPPDAHKYTAGTVTVVAGSDAYAGAAELSCRGAWRDGAGPVPLLGPVHHPAAWPETIWTAWRPADDGARAALERAFVAKRAAVTVIGPGLADTALPHLPDLLRLAPGPVVLDATALALGAWPPDARAALRARGGAVMTPHAGEAAALLDSSPGRVVADPLAAAARLADSFGATVVLKGPTTVIRAPDGRVAVSERGHPGMASGGTGDVLAGVIGALLAPEPRDAFMRACAAVWLHGVAGELAAQRAGLGMVAGDLAEALPEAAAAAGAAAVQ